MSAEPDFDEKLRLPCLATGTPLPATTIAAAVEMLKVPALSPPVPTVSMAPAGAAIGKALARMVRAAPVISSTVSPRSRNAIRNAPICDGVALPDIIDVERRCALGLAQPLARGERAPAAT